MTNDQATCKPKGEPKFAGNGVEFRRTSLRAILTMEAVGHTMLRTLILIALTFRHDKIERSGYRRQPYLS